MKILGIETSCDETGVAIYDDGAAAEDVTADAEGGNREVRDTSAQDPQEHPGVAEPRQEHEVLVAGS